MAQVETLEASADLGSRESSVFEYPEYKLTYAHDFTLQWDPPADSKELAIALSWHFPKERNIESKMQAATKRFLRLERKKSTAQKTRKAQSSALQECPHRKPLAEQSKSLGQANIFPAKLVRIEPSRNWMTPSQKTIYNFRAEMKPKVQTWDPEMRELKPRGRKRAYEKEEASKVAANRGNACDDHRRQKLKCDPASCLRNKQNLKSPQSWMRGSPKPSDTSLQILSSADKTERSPIIRTLGDHSSVSVHPKAGLVDYSSLTIPSIRQHTGHANGPGLANKSFTFKGSEQAGTSSDPPFSFSPQVASTNVSCLPLTSATSTFSPGHDLPHGDMDLMSTAHPWFGDSFGYLDNNFFDDAAALLGDFPIIESPNIAGDTLPIGDVLTYDDQSSSTKALINSESTAKSSSENSGYSNESPYHDSQRWKFGSGGGSTFPLEHSTRDIYEIDRYCLYDHFRNKFRSSRTRDLQNYRSRGFYDASYDRAKYILPYNAANNKRMRGARVQTTRCALLKTQSGPLDIPRRETAFWSRISSRIIDISEIRGN